ncbi:FAD-binding protein [Clostridia bacterium]|nr:FAD-binding protein [Clostridia bacterium]
MRESVIKREDGKEIKVYTLNTVVVGTGAAGFNAADRLHGYGQTDIAMVTEDINAGTSRNTGSDKQTYYKLTLSGGDPDSVRDMAQTLFDGKCVDGDIALCEAALSAPGFLRLVDLGVPFPRGRYGEYIGYKTDHDPRRRATSVGPYTSKKMTEVLEKSVKSKGIKIFDRMQAVKILTENGQARGLLCLDLDRDEFTAFCCKNIIYCTGGPAGMYADSVYPIGHCGAAGIAFEAGVAGKNLTEWQYGLASVAPRWNVSGTYMQALPKFISTDKNRGDAREFLPDFFGSAGDMLTKVFLKGYQWPFDVRKIDGGSSVIDILVYLETAKGRRVFLDFRDNPLGSEPDYSALSPETREYLEKAGACFGKPIDRLLHMNAPAVDFYRDKGVDISSEPLEIALCAQHNNGGLGIDCWWQTNISGFFAAGEAAASHGVYRPGGSALNAGQAGSARAAQYVSANRQGAPESCDGIIKAALEDARAFAGTIIGDKSNLTELWDRATVRMSLAGGPIRNIEGISDAIRQVRKELADFEENVRVSRAGELGRAFRLKDILISQLMYLSAMAHYIETGGSSRGSALYTDPAGQKPYDKFPDAFTFRLGSGEMIQEALYNGGTCFFSLREPRPIPEDDDFFENVWRDFRETGNNR